MYMFAPYEASIFGTVICTPMTSFNHFRSRTAKKEYRNLKATTEPEEDEPEEDELLFREIINIARRYRRIGPVWESDTEAFGSTMGAERGGYLRRSTLHCTVCCTRPTFAKTLERFPSYNLGTFEDDPDEDPNRRYSPRRSPTVCRSDLVRCMRHAAHKIAKMKTTMRPMARRISLSLSWTSGNT
ncbi:hypothetical protein C7974DRAFT_114053 [Boeremia exigua]|uniref:uncharacterized protein n=1 Tax=Boeremia exigua TaxID=749465 RepID=UPI001E8EB187|nr:uncharacterized protein C7974DRAFT_114053 [Boeremia exigua]KAH6642989.1 hypothetical protein C7974DRAFT_114053 [Boeremia exigua]